MSFFIIDTPQSRSLAVHAVRQLTRSPVMQVEIRPYKRNRSQAQNRLMWVWYGYIADHIGCDPEDLHEQMKVRILGTERKVILGQAIIMPRSTAKLGVEEMTRFLEAIEALAMDLEVRLPPLADYAHAMGLDKRTKAFKDAD